MASSDEGATGSDEVTTASDSDEAMGDDQHGAAEVETPEGTVFTLLLSTRTPYILLVLLGPVWLIHTCILIPLLVCVQSRFPFGRACSTIEEYIGSTMVAGVKAGSTTC